MEWEFTPEQIVKAETDYGFDDFRRDLYREVRMNSGNGDTSELKATYDLLYDLCYWLATGRQFEEFVAQYRHSPPICEFLSVAHAPMAANAEMLGAILQRMIMARIEEGLSIEDSVADVQTTVERLAISAPSAIQ